jgi:metal-responsive CopG/Arc/MetJ family transcriptional regulator
MPARTTRNISITMPIAMAKDASRLAKRESRTMSELFREALRHYQASRQKPKRMADDDDAIIRMFHEARENPVTQAQFEAEDRLLNEYGARQAAKRGIKESDVVRIIHESRTRRETS